MLVVPEEYDLQITCGITFEEVTFQLFGTNNVPLDYDGWTIQATARVSPDDAVVIDFEPEWIDDTIGKFKFPEITPTNTNAILPGVYYYDVVLISPTSQRKGPYISGEVTVNKINSQPS